MWEKEQEATQQDVEDDGQTVWTCSKFSQNFSPVTFCQRGKQEFTRLVWILSVELASHCLHTSHWVLHTRQQLFPPIFYKVFFCCSLVLQETGFCSPGGVGNPEDCVHSKFHHLEAQFIEPQNDVSFCFLHSWWRQFHVETGLAHSEKNLGIGHFDGSPH